MRLDNISEKVYSALDRFVGRLVVFNVPLTARSFRDSTLFTVPCEGHQAGFLHSSHRESNPGPPHTSPFHNRCTTLAPALIEPGFLIWTVLRVATGQGKVQKFKVREKSGNFRIREIWNFVEREIHKKLGKF